MRILRSLIAASAVVCLLTAGCSGSNTSAGGGGTAASSSASGTGLEPLDKWCTAVGDLYCEALFTCCTRPDELAYDGGSLEACKALWKPGGDRCPFDGADDIDRLKRWFAAGETVFDQARLDACVAELKSVVIGASSCLRPPRDIVYHTCWAAFRGQVAPGAPCDFWLTARVGWVEFSSSAECQDGVCFRAMNSPDNNTCVAFTPSGETTPMNGLCNLTERDVFFGGKCHRQLALGAPCDPLYDQLCLSSNCDASGTCAPTTPDWSGCGYNWE